MLGPASTPHDAASGGLPFYTIGHSTRTIPEFVELLKVGDVELVVDIRTVPRSRTNPLYNLETLPDELARVNIGHAYIRELGGLRKRSTAVPPDENAFWSNKSFHNYADYALSHEFRDGLLRLLELGQAQRCAIMCSEAVWWRCHRRIVADYLLQRGRKVYHLMGRDRIGPATMTNGAVTQDERIVYPGRAR